MHGLSELATATFSSLIHKARALLHCRLLTVVACQPLLLPLLLVLLVPCRRVMPLVHKPWVKTWGSSGAEQVGTQYQSCGCITSAMFEQYQIHQCVRMPAVSE